MADLTVCGAGIFGLSIAWEALCRGANVTVVDPYGPGAGASGGIVGALQPHTPEPWNEKKQFQFESLLIAETFWSSVEQASGRSSGYSRVGRLQALASERELDRAQARMEAARQNWGRDFKWEVVGAKDLDEWHPQSATGYCLFDTLSAILNPRRAIESLAMAIQSRGGVISEKAPLIEPVVWATGWQGLKDLSQHFGTPVGNGVKGQALLLDYNAAGAPQIYADGLHIIPHLDGTVAIGSTSERDFDDVQNTDHQLDDLLARAISAVPCLEGACMTTRWAGVRPRAVTRAPLLGPWPGRPGHFIANGGFKIGFGMAPKVAPTLLDLVLDKKDNIPSGFHTNALL